MCSSLAKVRSGAREQIHHKVRKEERVIISPPSYIVPNSMKPRARDIAGLPDECVAHSVGKWTQLGRSNLRRMKASCKYTWRLALHNEVGQRISVTPDRISKALKVHAYRDKTIVNQRRWTTGSSVPHVPLELRIIPLQQTTAIVSQQAQTREGVSECCDLTREESLTQRGYTLG